MQRIHLLKRPAKNFRTDDRELHHQFSRVLRSRPGDRVVFFAEEWSCEYEILDITKHDIGFIWIKDISVISETRNVTLFQSLPNKIEKIEYLVQKGVEVGVSRFVFFRSERSQPLPILEKKFDRIRQIAKEALEQSQGFQLPELRISDDIFQEIRLVEHLAILHTANDARTKSIRAFSDSLAEGISVGFLVWPEGGFSDAEVEEYITLGATPISLGRRILRTETAGIIAGFMLAQ